VSVCLCVCPPVCHPNVTAPLLALLRSKSRRRRAPRAPTPRPAARAHRVHRRTAAHRHSRHARSRSHHGHRAAIVTPESLQAAGKLPCATTLSLSTPPSLSPVAVELSSCRGTRLRRAAVEAVVEGLSRPCLSSLVEPVEFLSSPVEADSMCRPVELSSLCRVSLSRLSSLCRVCCRARAWHVALLFCMKHSDSHSSRPRGRPTHKPPSTITNEPN
jgi:hypothetical protein